MKIHNFDNILDLFHNNLPCLYKIYDYHGNGYVHKHYICLMAELHLIGEISEAYGFGSNSLFCRFSVQGGINHT